MQISRWWYPIGLSLSMAAIGVSAIAATPACPKIRGIAHQGYFIADNAKTEHFYAEVLGFSPMKPRRNKEGVIDMLKFRVGPLHTLELFLEKNAADPRHYHFAIFTEDGEAMRQCLAAYGTKVPSEPIQNMANFFSRDEDGVITEIIDIRKYAADLDNPQKRSGISQQIDHIGFVVPHLDKALRFYIGFLGFKEISRYPTGDNGAIAVKLQVPGSQEYIELIEAKHALTLAEINSLNHLALIVDAPLALAERLSAKGVKLGKKSQAQVDIYDPDGIKIELLANTQAKSINGK